MRAIALKIEIYDGEYQGDMSALTLSCMLEGTVEGLASSSFLDGVIVVLEMCEKRYSTPTPLGASLTIFIGRNTHKGPTPLARLDVRLEDGFAHASILSDSMPRTTTEPVAVLADDDVVTLVRKIFAAGLTQ